MSIRIDGTNTTDNPGITGTDTDTGLQIGTNEVKVVTGGTEQATFDDSGNLVLDGGSDVRIELGSNGTTETNDRNHIRGDGDNVKYNSCDNGIHIFEVNGNEAFRIEETRTTLRGDGEHRCEGDFRPWANNSYDLGTSGDRWNRVYTNGLLFNGDTADENLLDDYEEGSWTPTADGGHTGISVDTNNCVYVKVGRIVHLTFEIYYPTGLSGSLFKIGGVPFQIDEESTGTVMLNSANFPTNRTMVTLYGNNSELRLYGSGHNQSWGGFGGDDVTTDASIMGTITYRST